MLVYTFYHEFHMTLPNLFVFIFSVSNLYLIIILSIMVPSVFLYVLISNNIVLQIISFNISYIFIFGGLCFRNIFPEESFHISLSHIKVGNTMTSGLSPSLPPSLVVCNIGRWCMEKNP